jgi:hypothetical protein
MEFTFGIFSFLWGTLAHEDGLLTRYALHSSSTSWGTIGHGTTVFFFRVHKPRDSETFRRCTVW